MSRMPPLDPGAIRNALPEGFDPTRLRVVGRVGSTNDVIRLLADRGAPAGTAVVAEEQERGRGRLGREWHSPPGLGIYLSVLRHTSRPPEELGRYGLAAAAAAREACLEVSDVDARIKWPNDLVVGGRKVAGVLAESWGRAPGLSVAVGLGVNVGHEAADFPPGLAPFATSLAMEGALPDRAREALVAAFLVRFAELADLLESGAWGPVRVRWEGGALPLEGRRVVWTDGGGVRSEARVIGLTDAGTLALVRSDGRRGEATQGESLRWME